MYDLRIKQILKPEVEDLTYFYKRVKQYYVSNKAATETLPSVILKARHDNMKFNF